MRVRLAVAQQYQQKSLALRPVEIDRVLRYAEAIRKGTQLPPIHLGEYPTDAGVRHLVIDGLHTLAAHVLLKSKTVPVVMDRYADEAHAMADQLNKNIRHGLELRDHDRNERIKLLANRYGWTLRQIGKEIGLHYTGVGRIIRGVSHRSIPGPRPGSLRRVQPADPHKFIRIIKTCDVTLTDQQRKEALLHALVQDAYDGPATLARIADTGRHLIAFATEARRVLTH